jgi:SAM-dependent methyltransferase
MFHFITRPLMANPTLYHYLRQVMAGGMPFERYVDKYGLADPGERVGDIGCGPADMLRYLGPGRRPAFYLGVDISQAYLDAARARANKAGVESEFARMDLDRIPHDAAVRQQLVDLLDRHRITTALLLGVVHHINDEAARTTIDLIHSASTVRKLITWDVVYLPGRRLNNFLCDQDRGQFVRTEPAYDALAAGSRWARHEKWWSSPRVSMIKYLHYIYTK